MPWNVIDSPDCPAADDVINAPELDAVLTLSERKAGIMQPWPLTTLHVGGAITSDGGLTVSGPVTSTGLTVTGSTTVNGKSPAVSPDAGNTLAWNANGLFVPAALTQDQADTRYVNVTETPYPAT